jgi:hypothetical protein
LLLIIIYYYYLLLIIIIVIIIIIINNYLLNNFNQYYGHCDQREGVVMYVNIKIIATNYIYHNGQG